MNFRELQNFLKPIREFTPYNLQPLISTSRNKQTSLQMPSRYIKKLLAAEVIKEVPIVPKQFVPRRDYAFYSWNRARPNHVNYKEIDHRSMLEDVAIHFLKFYPDCHLEYERTVPVRQQGAKAIQCDLIVKWEKYTWIVELEKSRTPAEIEKDKLERFDNIADTSARVLFVYAPRNYPFSLRPSQYENPGMPQVIGKALAGTQDLAQRFRKPYYLAMSFHDFYRLNKAVWLNSKGEKCQLVY